MDLVKIYMRQQLVEQSIGGFQVANVLRGKERREALLPEVMASFDLALGLGGGRVAQGNAVEMEGGAQLGEGVRSVGKEKGMVINVECQRQAMSFEGAREEIEVSQEIFGAIKAGSDIVAGGIIEDVEERLFIGLAGQPIMGRGIVLPERPQITGLPPFDWFGPGFEAGIGRQLVVDGPAADTGPVGFELESAKQFAGGGAVGGGRFGSQKLLEQGDDLGRPIGAMIATGSAGTPSWALATRTGTQVVAEEFVEPAARQAQFLGGLSGRELLVAVISQQVSD